MRFSGDYTYVESSRTAQLSDEMIQRILDRYNSELDRIDFNIIYAHLMDLPAKADLLAEWVVKSIAKGKGTTGTINQFENMARFYLNARNTPRFKKAVAAYAEETEMPFNPRNILDFTLYDLEEIHDLYEQPEVHPRVNLLQNKLPEGTSLFYNDGEYQIVEVTSPQSACQLASGTKWCTSDEEKATEYLGEAPLYVIYLRGKKRAQFHVNLSDDDLNGIQLQDLRARNIVPDEALAGVLWKSGLLPTALNSVIERGIDKEFLIFEVEAKTWLRFPVNEMRKFVTKSPYLSLSYATEILDEVFPEGEQAIASKGETSFWYAMDTLKGRFLLGEPAIIRDRSRLYEYLSFLFYRRFGTEEYNSFIDQYGDNPKVRKIIAQYPFNQKSYEEPDESYGQYQEKA
jgi:hypothetical protein